MRNLILLLFIQLPVNLLAQQTDSTAVAGTESRFVIRCGSTSLEEPLYVVDGVIWEPAEIRQLNVNRIKAISILKEPAAGAIFGRPARGGVIVIELTPVPDTIFQIRCARNGEVLRGVTAVLRPVGATDDSLVLRSDESGFIRSSALSPGIEYLVELRQMGYQSSTIRWRSGSLTKIVSLEPEFREMDNVVVRVYPNPVQRGATTNVTLPEGKEGRWQLQLFSISGQLVQTRPLMHAGKSNQHQVPITAAIPAASYLLQLQGPAGERITEKIIVQ